MFLPSISSQKNNMHMANNFDGGLVEQKAAERRQISGIKLGRTIFHHLMYVTSKRYEIVKSTSTMVSGSWKILRTTVFLVNHSNEHCFFTSYLDCPLVSWDSLGSSRTQLKPQVFFLPVDVMVSLNHQLKSWFLRTPLLQCFLKEVWEQTLTISLRGSLDLNWQIFQNVFHDILSAYICISISIKDIYIYTKYIMLSVSKCEWPFRSKAGDRQLHSCAQGSKVPKVPFCWWEVCGWCFLRMTNRKTSMYWKGMNLLIGSILKVLQPRHSANKTCITCGLNRIFFGTCFSQNI